MEQLHDYADERLKDGCVYCGARIETREHTPPKAFLTEPYPENLPVIGACEACNNGFSLDEQYLACLIEVVMAGTADPDQIGRDSVAGALRRSSALREKFEAARCHVNGRPAFNIEETRVGRVMAKLAQGHAAYELSAYVKRAPDLVQWKLLELMTEDERAAFNAVEILETFGEVGSRALQRVLVTQLHVVGENGEPSVLNLLINDWVEVQEGWYRYHATDDAGQITVRIVIREYLAGEVIWEDVH